MTRRPREHDRKPTVVTSGPQAGKARAGSTVNKGIHYDDATKTSGADTKGALLDMAGEETECTEHSFMPEHLRVLPENPAELFSDMEIEIMLDGGEKHRLRWTPDGVELMDHDYVAEKVVQSLDGDVCRCVEIKDTWEAEPALLNSRVDRLTLLQGMEVLSGGGEGVNHFEDFVLRMGKTGASMYVARQAVDAWLQHHGAPPLKDNRTLLFAVDTSSERANAKPPSYLARYMFSTGTYRRDSRPVLGYATWTPSSPPRFSGVVTSDFYDDVRQNGYLVDGKLNLGKNALGQVLLHVDTVNGDAFSVMQGVEPAENLRPHPNEPAEGEDETGRQFIGVYRMWDDNGEYYYSTDGVRPAGMHRSAADADLWSRHEDVRSSMMDIDTHISLFADEFDTSRFPSDFNLNDVTQSDLMELAALRGERPTVYSVEFSHYMTVSPSAE